MSMKIPIPVTAEQDGWLAQSAFGVGVIANLRLVIFQTGAQSMKAG